MILSGRLCMQLRASLHICSASAAYPWMQLVLRFTSCSAPTARLWMQLHASRLLPAHGCNFMLRACYHTHGYNFVLRACYRARFASHAHDGTAAPEGTTFACAPLPRLLMKHLQHKITFYNICSKQMKHLQHTLATCVWALQHIQHPDKTLATYV
jgi:hypothetical protein